MNNNPMKKDGGSAFPVHGGAQDENGNYFDDPRNQIIGGGIRTRDYFAAKALQGELSCQTNEMEWLEQDFFRLAERSYKIADAMLKARKK